MAETVVRGVTLRYEIVGGSGPWVALSPGGHRDMSGVREIGELIAARGHRVLLHDRRNCGASDVAIDGSASEYEHWADDLNELLAQVGASPAYVGGTSSGCRTSLLLALRHPESVRGLLLWRITGGPFAVQRLAREYYGQYVEIAQRGGMEAICETPYFKERIEARPSNGTYLRAMDPAYFIEVYSRWRDGFLADDKLPVIGATAELLGSIKAPTVVIPGNDRTHGRATGELVSRLIPGCELHVLLPRDEDVDVADWTGHQASIASVLAGFLAQH